MAEKDKIFYWIKLKKEFLDGETVDFLMSQKNGANYIVLYQMLIMKTLNTSGKLCNEIGEVIIPFNAEKIQRDCKWFDIDTVRVAMELYAKLGLIFKNENNIFQITNFEEIVGSETYWAKKKREKRLEKDSVGQIPTNVQNPLISNIYNIKDNISDIDNNINNSIYNNKEEDKNIISISISDVLLKVREIYYNHECGKRYNKKDTLERLTRILNSKDKKKRLNHSQILLAYIGYFKECYIKGKESYLKCSETFLTSKVYDYVEKTQVQYEQAMQNKYGDNWRDIKYTYTE